MSVETKKPKIEATSESVPEFEVGSPVDRVKFDIDYAIIKHFSEHLYSSPNKAIEELVSNGFDALATKCYVYVPGPHVSDKVVVWDNGLSMDPSGMQAMWQIARSPKEDAGPGRIVEAEGRRRAMIGKFGIGKLASYAVGYRITHYCKTGDGGYFSVSVNYRDFTGETADTAGAIPDAALEAVSEIDGHSTAPKVDIATETGATSGAIRIELTPAGAEDDPTQDLSTPILELTEEDAQSIVQTLLGTSDACAAMLAEPHWTLAVIEDLKEVSLYPGRLMWVLGNGMPLRPDFAIFVEDKPVQSRLEKKAEATWDLADEEIIKSIQNAWKEAASDGKVSGELDVAPGPIVDSDRMEGDPHVDDPAIVFPHLGRVTATVRVFEKSLSVTDDEQGRSYGFFLSVRGRLVNPDDDKLLLNDPSFGTFYRSQFQIRADGLDGDLLADRESLRRDTPMTRELAALQSGLYRLARKEVEQRDSDKAKKARPESRLPTRSRELFRDPMTALLVRRGGEAAPGINLNEPVIERAELGAEMGIAELDGATGNLVVNKSHPFFVEIDKQAGGGKRGAAVLAAFDLIAVSERLSEGFLYGRGVPDEQITDLLTWRDNLLRALAEGYARNPEDVILELRAASVPGDTRFELAIESILTLMGFSVTHDGDPGMKDLVVTAPLGPGHRVFTVEAKGSAVPVENVPAALAGAAAHRDAVEDAGHAVVVAREFAGFKQKDEPAILQECQAVKGVSLMTVETLIQLYRALATYAYPLESVMDAMFVIETPAQKQERVEGLEKPLDAFNFRDVLEEIWARQSGESIADQVPVRALWQSRQEWRKEMTWQEFQDKVVALDHFAGQLLIFDQNERTVYLKQHPQKVAEHIERVMSLP